LLGGEGTYFPRAHSFLAAASRFAKVGVRLVRLVRLAKVSASLVVIITSKIAESITEVVVVIALYRIFNSKRILISKIAGGLDDGTTKPNEPQGFSVDWIL
jgi:hypothetical protein